MSKPQTKAALIRYLAQHFYLRFEFPEEVKTLNGKDRVLVEGRRFLRKQNQRLVFAKPDGEESFLNVKPNEIEFHDDHFAVKFPPDWKDAVNYRIRYFYLNEECPDPVQVTSV